MSVNPVLGKVAVTVWTFNKFLTLWRRIGFYMRHSSFSTMYWIASRHREIRLGFAGSTTHDDVFFMYLQGFKRGLQLRYGATTRSHNLSIFSVEDDRLVYKEWFLMMAFRGDQPSRRKQFPSISKNDCFSYYQKRLLLRLWCQNILPSNAHCSPLETACIALYTLTNICRAAN